MGTLTVFTQSEGYANRYYSYETWSVMHAGAGTGASNPTGGAGVQLTQFVTGPSTGNYQQMNRGMCTFDTSALTSAATVTAAVYRANPNLLASTFFTGPVNAALKIGVYDSTQASDTTVVAADYQAPGTTLQSDFIFYSAMTQDSQFELTLTSTGRSSISKTGTTKFAIYEGTYDAPNSAPPFRASSYWYISVYSDFGNATYSQQLVITYTGDPTVTTQAASDVLPTSVTGNGNITSIGGASPTRRGFAYKVGTSGDPTTSDSVSYEDGSFSTGAYTLSITGLTESTSYRVRAYAVNSVGTSYGSTVQEATPASTAIKTIDGLANASIKTVNDLAIASMKTWDGLE